MPPRVREFSTQPLLANQRAVLAAAAAGARPGWLWPKNDDGEEPWTQDLHQMGWTVSRLVREFGLSRTTVYKELGSPEPRRYVPRIRPRLLKPAASPVHRLTSLEPAPPAER